ncbi:hypothetical protein [Actinoallomurus sp. CA-142502]|uniref:hypothetical protein n=1 Tax=Actinoallomurus sp. CA-142502 TaxID=3239885 RepID=UPI003D910C09
MDTSIAETGNAPPQPGIVLALDPTSSAGSPAVAAAATPEQLPASTATTVAAGSTGLIIVLLIGFVLWRALDKKKAKPMHLALAFTMGALLSGSMVGVMAKQTADSIGSGVATMFSTVTTSGGGHK